MYKCSICSYALYFYFCIDKCTTQSYYYLGFFLNNGGGSESFLLTTTESQLVDYLLYIPKRGYRASGKITANNSVTLNIPNMEASTYSHIDYGIYLKLSSDKVTVIGQNYESHTSDSYLALPTIKLKTVTEYAYYAMSVHSPNSYSSILIVGTEDNTQIHLEATQSTRIYSSRYYRYRGYYNDVSRGSRYSFVINRLQTRYMESTSDLSGTKIIANKPVSVFTGHRCAYVPYNYGNCGYLIEQIPPTTSWGTSYYVAPLATRTSYTIKVLAAYDSTNVTISCNGTAVSYSVNEKSHVTKTLDNQEYCIIYANKKVLVAQFSGKNNEDPSMTLVPTSNNFISKFQFPTFDHPTDSYYYPTYVNIIVMAEYYQPDSIHMVTGGLQMSLYTQEWTPFRINNVIEAYATKVSVLHGIVEITHNNVTALMTVLVYGVTARNSYMHFGGLSDTVGKPAYCTKVNRI